MVAAAGVIPDIDGLGIVAEFLTKDSERPLLWWSEYHHVIAHNLGFGLLVAAIAFALTRRCLVVALTTLSFHLHLLGERWLPFLPGVYLMNWAAPTWRAKVKAATLWAGPEALASHRTAAALWKFLDVQEGYVEISAPYRIVPSVEWLKVYQPHSLKSQVRRVRDGIALTSPPRTIVDLAGLMKPRRLERIIDEAIRRKQATLEEIWHELSQVPSRGRAGTGTLKRLLERHDPNQDLVQSSLESDALRIFAAARIPPPVCQYVIGEGSSLIGEVDFAWPDQKVIVEVDSFQHHSGRAPFFKDIARYNRLLSQGYAPLRFAQEHVDDLGHQKRFTQQLRQALKNGPGSLDRPRVSP
jgi:hypothetical protein